MAIFKEQNTLYTCKGVGMSYIHDLDALAAANVIEFDAPSYIRGTSPRYVGNPPLEMIPDQLAPIKEQPKRDEFVKQDPHNNPTWKKVLFGAVAIGVVVGSVILGKNIAKNAKLKKRMRVNGKLILRRIRRIPTKIKNGAIKLWNWIKSVPTKIKNSAFGKKVAGWFHKPKTTTP